MASRRLLKQTGVGILSVIMITLVLGQLFDDELKALGFHFVEQFGGLGVAVCCAGPDALPMPPPHEVCMAFARLGGMPFWEVVAWATGGSLTGGSIGYFIGRSLAKTSWFQRIIGGRGRLAWESVQRNGPIALAIGALSPIPYSICCWASGAMNMRLGVFLAVSLLRLPRLAFYLWLVQLGLVDLHLQ
ncbi:MAG: membrane protein YqaA with SNARE-associated domain [Myxococcota bacterium]